ncbi:PAS domain S-box protein [Paenibacillus whitsoniae]|nr:PAS domain S-box protein [Paenibacillus whitsoniae]
MKTRTDSPPIGFIILDAVWNFKYVNDFGAQVLNRKPTDLIGKHVWTEFPKAVRHAVYHLFMQARTTEEEVEFEEFVKPSGMWVHVNAYCVSDCIHVVIRQIQMIEREVTLQSEFFYKYTDHVQDLIMLTTDDGMIRYVSPSINQLLGYEDVDVIGTNVLDYCYEGDLSALQGSYLAKFDEASRGKGTVTCRFLHKQGGTVWFENNFNWLVNEDGERSEKLGIWRDVTKRKHIEEELTKSKANLEMAHKIAGLGHYDWDILNNVVYASQGLLAIFGLELDTLRLPVEAFFDCIHPQDVKQLQEDMERAFQTGSMNSSYRIMLGDGQTQRIFHTLARTTYDEAGRPVRFFGTSQDITLQKQTEELLRKAEKLNVAGQLAAGIAHEIRNPLTSLKGFAKLMCHAGDDNKQRYYTIMQDEFNRIELILGELLILAKPQAVQYLPHAPLTILEDVIALLNTEAVLKNVLIEWTYEADLPLVLCEQNQLKQVFVNVIKNAIEAMKDGGSLMIHVRRCPEGICLTFIDQGHGIPEDRLPRIGEPFYTTKEKGTGLGMMVSFTIIEEHRGSIRYESQVGVGTTVSIFLPGQEGNCQSSQ